MKDLCAKCGKLRALKRVFGQGLHPKGEEICRPCYQALKFAAKENKK